MTWHTDESDVFVLLPINAARKWISTKMEEARKKRTEEKKRRMATRKDISLVVAIISTS